MSSRSIATGQKKSRSKLIQILIIFGVIALIGVAFGVNVLGVKKKVSVQQTLLEMKLGNYTDGAEAIKQVSQLHGTGIELTGAVIADYSHDFNPYHNSNDRVNVWIGKTKTSAEASDLLNRMVQAIQQGKGKSPFSNVRQISVDGREVFQVDGPGGSFYFYAISDAKPRVVWLSINAGNPSPILREAIRIF